jgi:hypothetical protein
MDCLKSNMEAIQKPQNQEGFVVTWSVDFMGATNIEIWRNSDRTTVPGFWCHFPHEIGCYFCCASKTKKTSL